MDSCMSIPFEPHPWLRNRHVMTLFPRFYPRRGLLAGIPSEERLFNVAAGSFIKGLCHWQPVRSQTLTVVLVHGLEGCHDSQYMQGTAAKAFRAGFNVIRLNQRNCGNTESLTPTLYNSALSGDIQAVLTELASKDGLRELWAVGWSMGGKCLNSHCASPATAAGSTKADRSPVRRWCGCWRPRCTAPATAATGW